MSLGLTPPQIRNRLLIFSIAAPAGAILTYLAVRLFGASQHVKAHHVDPLQWWTGAVLLFSVSRHFFCGLVWHSLQGSLTSLSDQGGSFLYVATVISPLSDSDSHHTPRSCQSHSSQWNGKVDSVPTASIVVGRYAFASAFECVHRTRALVGSGNAH